MTMPRTLRVALPGALLGSAIAVTPALAFQPSVQMAPDTTNDFLLTDLGSRGSLVAATTDAVVSGTSRVGLLWSTDSGAT